VVDAATAHVVALDHAPELDIETFIISSPTSFYRTEAAELKHDAVAVIGHHFPDASALWPKASRLCHGFRSQYVEPRVSLHHHCLRKVDREEPVRHSFVRLP
jgi:hypothetical protein